MRGPALIEPLIPSLRRSPGRCAGTRTRRTTWCRTTWCRAARERAVSAWGGIRTQASLRAWLFAILHNRFISTRRQQTRQGPHEPPEDEDGRLGPGQAVPVPARLGIATLRRRTALASAAVVLALAGGAGGWVARDRLPRPVVQAVHTALAPRE